MSKFFSCIYFSVLGLLGGAPGGRHPRFVVASVLQAASPSTTRLYRSFRDDCSSNNHIRRVLINLKDLRSHRARENLALSRSWHKESNLTVFRGILVPVFGLKAQLLRRDARVLAEESTKGLTEEQKAAVVASFNEGVAKKTN